MAVSGENMKLTTKNFNDTITQFRKYISEFGDVIVAVSQTILAVEYRWKGEGAKEFSYDCTMVQANLNDIRDIMEEMCLSLEEAGKEYLKNDSELAKSWNT